MDQIYQINENFEAAWFHEFLEEHRLALSNTSASFLAESCKTIAVLHDSQMAFAKRLISEGKNDEGMGSLKNSFSIRKNTTRSWLSKLCEEKTQERLKFVEVTNLTSKEIIHKLQSLVFPHFDM